MQILGLKPETCTLKKLINKIEAFFPSPAPPAPCVTTTPPPFVPKEYYDLLTTAPNCKDLFNRTTAVSEILFRRILPRVDDYPTEEIDFANIQPDKGPKNSPPLPDAMKIRVNEVVMNKNTRPLPFWKLVRNWGRTAEKTGGI